MSAVPAPSPVESWSLDGPLRTRASDGPFRGWSGVATPDPAQSWGLRRLLMVSDGFLAILLRLPSRPDWRSRAIEPAAALDRFDALHIHDPDWFPDEALDGALKALMELKASGEIGAVGVGVNAWAIAVHDLDDDGRLDAVVANQGSDDVSILIGRGDGGFDTLAVGRHERAKVRYDLRVLRRYIWIENRVGRTTTSATALPSPPCTWCSSAVTMAPVSCAAFMINSSSRGLMV